MDNYTIIDNNLITNLRISDGAYRCYNLLLSMCYGKRNSCYPSIKFMAISVGRSCRTINRYIKELVELGLIAKRRRGSTSNIYTLLQKKTSQVVEKVKEVIDDVKKAYKQKKQYHKKESVFNNFPQREYDYDDLESKLLGWVKVPDKDGTLYDQRSF